jgi:2-keto-3-deoxy-L-rhamnonate aldolase RhmA
MTSRPAPAEFRARLLAHEPLLGTFIKTPATQPVEVLGAAGLDFVVIDQEHAPFDRVTVDALILAGKAAGIAVLVRVPGSEARDILPALDCGAQGVLVPHVDTVARARDVVAGSRYAGGWWSAGRVRPRSCRRSGCCAGSRDRSWTARPGRRRS